MSIQGQGHLVTLAQGYVHAKSQVSVLLTIQWSSGDWIKTRVAMATYVSNRLIMGKCENCQCAVFLEIFEFSFCRNVNLVDIYVLYDMSLTLIPSKRFGSGLQVVLYSLMDICCFSGSLVIRWASDPVCFVPLLYSCDLHVVGIAWANHL